MMLSYFIIIVKVEKVFKSGAPLCPDRAGDRAKRLKTRPLGAGGRQMTAMCLGRSTVAGVSEVVGAEAEARRIAGLPVQ